MSVAIYMSDKLTHITNEEMNVFYRYISKTLAVEGWGHPWTYKLFLSEIVEMQAGMHLMLTKVGLADGQVRYLLQH